MSLETTRRWQESWPVAGLMLAALGAGAYLIVMRLPALLEPTPLADFPIVVTVMALFGYLSVVHVALHGLTRVLGWIKPRL